MGFPIDRSNYRTLDPGWEGQVFVADIDRTYLATRISSLRGMARIPFETAADKKDIEGMAQLLREIRRGPNKVSRDTPLFFVSASPKQLRTVIERKMAIDGIGFDGTTFKDWARVFRRARLKRLREQVGFKLTALMTNRAHLPMGAHEILIGDDLETDPVTFAIYADSLAGRIPVSDLPRILRLNGVLESDAAALGRARRDLRGGRGVLRAFIRLEKHTDTDDFLEFGPGVVGCTGAFQMAVAMWKLGSISRGAIGRVGADLVARGIDRALLTERLVDIYRRAILSRAEVEELGQQLADHGTIAPLSSTLPAVDDRWQRVWQRSVHRVWTPARFVGE